MKPELRKAVDAIGTLHNLNAHHIEDLAAMLFIKHYRHSVPMFGEKVIYENELNSIAPLLPSLQKYRGGKTKQTIKQFRADNIIV